MATKGKHKRIAIITDGGLSMGMGHVYRTLSLADNLLAFAQIEFVTQSGDIVVQKVKDSGFSVSKFNNEEEIQHYLAYRNPDVVVIDKLDVAPCFSRYIKETLKAKVVIFGNLSLGNRYADVVVNAIIGTDFKNRSFFDKSTRTLYLQGPKYLVLRDEFYENTKQCVYRANLRNVLLIFGGSDPANLSCKVLRKIFRMEHNLKVDIVLGPQFGFISELNNILELADKSRDDVAIHYDVDNVSHFMLNSDLVMTSGGTTMFEAFCLGLPTIAFYQNELQKVMFKGFIMTYDLAEIRDFESFVLSIYKAYHQHKRDIDALDVGGGKREILKSILEA